MEFTVEEATVVRPTCSVCKEPRDRVVVGPGNSNYNKVLICRDCLIKMFYALDCHGAVEGDA